jgi:hypothetical protein
MGTEKAIIKKPPLVWAICIFYFISTIITVSFILLVLFMKSGILPVTPEMKTHLPNFSSLDYLLSLIGCGISLTGALTLFTLRKITLYFFISNIFLLLINTFVQGGVPSSIIAFMYFLIALIIDIAICLYILRLSREGVLR